MGTCDGLFNPQKEKKKSYQKEEQKKQNNLGSNLYCAPINASMNNDNVYVDSTMSQMTMTQDMSHYVENKKPTIYQYINRYKTNGLQKSLAKASLVELGGQGNSLMMSNMKNSRANQTSIYTSRIDDTGYESSYDGVEMIIDGKMDEDLVKQSTDKNTINNYNEFIKKKDDNNSNKKVMDYYHKTFINNNNKLNDIGNNKDNKDGDDLSGIPPSGVNLLKTKNSNKNTKDNMQKYIQSMGKY